ncbi:hypothetical protein OG512_45870 [Streptomyces sp. NBC_01378]|uniref:hypothetical protein n=1 Tax=Streptomyces sp. NBC_01378 TaxID=2903844 RepID=UPI00324BD8D0
MRTKASRSVGLLAGAGLCVVGLVAGSGCGSQKAAVSDTDVRADRARQVAEAWDGSTAAAAWRAGFYPTGEEVQPPRGGLHDPADRQAYEGQNIVLRGKLPETGPKDGAVTWARGESLTRPLMGAHASYKTLAGTRVGGKPHLTVTGARLGEMSVATSRGPATVPAGFAPLLAAALVGAFGWPGAALLYLAAALTGLVGILATKETWGRDERERVLRLVAEENRVRTVSGTPAGAVLVRVSVSPVLPAMSERPCLAAGSSDSRSGVAGQDARCSPHRLDENG